MGVYVSRRVVDKVCTKFLRPPWWGGRMRRRPRVKAWFEPIGSNEVGGRRLAISHAHEPMGSCYSCVCGGIWAVRWLSCGAQEVLNFSAGWFGADAAEAWGQGGCGDLYDGVV